MGAILYYMTYGHPPSYHPGAAAPPRGHMPSHDPALRDILNRTLHLDPHARPDITALAFHPYTVG
jgi:hypothetical protein